LSQEPHRSQKHFFRSRHAKGLEILLVRGKIDAALLDQRCRALAGHMPGQQLQHLIAREGSGPGRPQRLNRIGMNSSAATDVP